MMKLNAVVLFAGLVLLSACGEDEPQSQPVSAPGVPEQMQPAPQVPTDATPADSGQAPEVKPESETDASNPSEQAAKESAKAEVPKTLEESPLDLTAYRRAQKVIWDRGGQVVVEFEQCLQHLIKAYEAAEAFQEMPKFTDFIQPVNQISTEYLTVRLDHDLRFAGNMPEYESRENYSAWIAYSLQLFGETTDALKRHHAELSRQGAMLALRQANLFAIAEYAAAVKNLENALEQMDVPRELLP